MQAVELVRGFMERRGWDALVISGTDPHESEYVGAPWRTREWVCGFTGSAGVVVVTRTAVALWTDSRYWLQAQEELAEVGGLLMRSGEPQTPEPWVWLRDHLGRPGTVGFEGQTTSMHLLGQWAAAGARLGLDTAWEDQVFEGLWSDRPALPRKAIQDWEGRLPGPGRREKLEALVPADPREAWVVSSLDDIAWVLNLRGADTEYNPVFLAHLWVQQGKTALFCALEALERGTRRDLEALGLALRPYEDWKDFLRQRPGETRVNLDPWRTNWETRQALDSCSGALRLGPLPTLMAKAVKTPDQLQAWEQVMAADGAALVRFFHWWDTGEEGFTEAQAAGRLQEFRRQVPGYAGDSFSTIPGWKDHGAVVHYSPGASDGAEIRGPGLLLLDSGAQYPGGTTDVTRVLVRGPGTQAQREDYTRVLQAHIRLALARFPQGTRGYQLDALARRGLWEAGLNYGHGTGHGVGAFLCVHEGPARISPHPVDTALVPGMVLSNEPGLYREGKWGIRLENLVTVALDRTTEFGTFYRLNTLTLAPFERRLIDPGLLEPQELAWLEAYHRRVREVLGPLVPPEVRTWLDAATAPLG